MNPIVLKIFYDNLFNEEEKKKILSFRSGRSKKVAEMIGMGLPRFKCDIIDFTDNDFETIAFCDFSYNIVVEDINYSTFENTLNHIKYWCLDDEENNISFNEFLESLPPKELNVIMTIKDNILNKEEYTRKFVDYMPTVLAINMGNISVRSWSGIETIHNGFYAFLFINNNFMSLYATRNKFNIKEALRGYVHPHVSPFCFTSFESIKLNESCSDFVNINGTEFINAKILRNVCLGDSDLGNIMSSYSGTNEDDIEMMCIMVSEELSRIFNSENDNQYNFPYIRMVDIIGDNQDTTKMINLNYGIKSATFQQYEVAKMIYTRKLFHFISNDKGYKCTDSILYIMDTITKCYTSMLRDRSALIDINEINAQSMYKYKTDGINVYMMNSRNTNTENNIATIKRFNNANMFSYKGNIIKYNVDIVEEPEETDVKYMLDSNFCANVLNIVSGLYFNTGKCYSNNLID